MPGGRRQSSNRDCQDNILLNIIKVVSGQALFIGKYCADEVLGVCVEQRKSFCCFNSMLAALIMASIRGVQNIGGGFLVYGTRDASDPNCEGITLEELAQVNFSIIDLSPWLNRLRAAGIYPDKA